MKVYIFIDIEGISGVVSPEQGSPGNPEYERTRLVMTEEANAAILWEKDFGSSQITR